MEPDELSDPNELLRLCYHYKVREIPVSKEQSITGKVPKQSLVRYLSRSEHFDHDLTETIHHLLEPVKDNFLDSLKEELRSQDIRGIPIVSLNGDVERVITPGVLETQEETEEFLEHSDQVAFYEELMDEVPFPLVVQKEGEVVYENGAHRNRSPDEENWTERQFTSGGYVVTVTLPRMIDRLFEGFRSLERGNPIDIRELLDKIEVQFLKKAKSISDSISGAAEHLSLPRQTFNYRWDNKVDSPQDDS